MSQREPIHDVFQRQFFAESLINLIQKVRAPYSIGIDAKWGNGKTTFVKSFLTPAADVVKIPIVVFDCFEHERAGDPLFSITKHILATLTPAADSSPEKDKVLAAVKGLAIGTGKVLVNAALQTLVKQNLSDLLANISKEDFAETAASDTTQKLEQFLAARLEDGFKEKAVREEFKGAVEKLANSLSDSGKIIVVIDELDRCRPNFALDVLEAMKHILNVNGLVFVLAYHRSQLCNAIEHQFGNGIDANMYLHKFVNIDFSLPLGEVKSSESKFDKLTSTFVKRFTNKKTPTDEAFVDTLFQLQSIYDLEIRTIERCIGIFYSTDPSGATTTPVLAVLVVWSVKFPSIMLKIQNEMQASDEDLETLQFERLSREWFANEMPFHLKVTLADNLLHILRPADDEQKSRAENARIAIRKFLSFG